MQRSQTNRAMRTLRYIFALGSVLPLLAGAQYSGGVGRGDAQLAIELPPRVVTDPLTNTVYLAGTSLDIGYFVFATLPPGNVFTAQLSDASGSFDAPVVIGSLSATGSGSIAATIPVGTPSGTAYRVRVATTEPGMLLLDNGSDLSIFQLPTVTCPIGPINVCFSSGVFDLIGGEPVGGTYSGTGVANNSFDPLVAGVGPHTITYTYTDGNNISNSCTFTITVVADTDGDGICDPEDNCPTTPGEIGDACDDGDPGTILDLIDGTCTCVGLACVNGLVLEFDTDGAPSETTWELRASGTGLLVQSGGGLPGPVNNLTLNTCLPDGCYYLRVLDSGGDGIANGGYILRTLAGAQRIIDNRDNFTAGSVSAVIGNGGFCLPLGTDKLIYTSCDKLDWVNGQYIVAAPNPAVSAQWQVGNQADDGYQFWWFDPNGSYGYSKFRSHATSDGFGPANAVRSCHARINNWSPNQIPANLLLNVKVRSRVNGVNSNWGPVCRFKIDPVQAACPLTKLMDIPGNQFYSCGVTRTWGGSNRIHARPVDGATQYQFRFSNGEFPAGVVRTTATYFLNLNWTPALPNGTYDVQVRAFKNGQWCVSSLPWGDICRVTITGSPATLPLPGAGTMVDAELALFPNPNTGDQLTLSLSSVEKGVETVSVDIFDLSGARVVAKVIPVNDGMVYTQISVRELSGGMYVVRTMAGDEARSQRLVIQP